VIANDYTIRHDTKVFQIAREDVRPRMQCQLLFLTSHRPAKPVRHKFAVKHYINAPAHISGILGRLHPPCAASHRPDDYCYRNVSRSAFAINDCMGGSARRILPAPQ
jgi:hypothetical protein